MRRCVCSASPLLKCKTRCFPVVSMDVTWAPMTRSICGPGLPTRAPRMGRSIKRGRKAAAVLKIVSPSGTPRLRMREWRHAHRQPKVLAAKASLLELCTQRRIERGLAVDALDAQLASRAVLGQRAQGRQGSLGMQL